MILKNMILYLKPLLEIAILDSYNGEWFIFGMRNIIAEIFGNYFLGAVKKNFYRLKRPDLSYYDIIRKLFVFFIPSI